MEYGNKFKKSLFGGFNRRDVLKCFEEFDSEHQKDIDSLKNTSENLKKDYDALKSQLDSVKLKLESKEEICEKQSQSIITYEEENKNLKLRIEELQRDLASQKALNTKLGVTERILENHNKNLKTKLEELNVESEKTRGEIDKIISSAKNTAEEIVSRAKEKSYRVVAIVKREALQAEENFEKADHNLENAIESFRNISLDVVKDMEQLHRNLKIAKANIRGANSELESVKKENGDVILPESKRKFSFDFLFRK